MGLMSLKEVFSAQAQGKRPRGDTARSWTSASQKDASGETNLAISLILDFRPLDL